ncbi:antibiotic biosynthesis monooxygenase [Qipengyuania sp. YG27]|uniref:Antibiotic biosynthesis monooxygenase n=1 Tax=Qipengyuania mesophila TaxID=2867246 RepID=A0ABS7JRH6_9SPHN|nr:antibiotic biosynthesis monooxygenase [Qipengyuania mesophila]MBX7500208.1 antibiotic biosynthesis monooxygenase [Qipengyuania mesophila]
MIAVIFELHPAEDSEQDYFDQAAKLAPLLADLEGFLSVERFASLSQPGKFLSLSFFKDEEAVARWRRTVEHRSSQALGRAGVFADYRLRVAEVQRDYGLKERTQAPADSRAVHNEV